MSTGPGAILGSYELVELIARGGMGEVYRARHRRLTDREVAIKVMPAVLAADPTFLQRFEREANNIAALSHQHILPLWDYGDQAGLPYIVMPLVRGGSLRDRMHGRRMEPAEVLRFIRPIAEVLDYAHARGIIHRDIKPANILLDDRGHLFVADFGIAKAIEGGVEALTRTGVGVGTPEYMAPEQTQGLADPRSDIYALGIITFEALSGRVPYTGKTPVDVAIKHATVPLPALDELGNIVSPALYAVVRKALAKSPSDRYASAGAFIQDFTAAIGGADSPTMNVVAADALTQVSNPGNPSPQTAFLAGSSTNQPTQAVATGSGRSSWRIAAITLAVGLVLGLLLAIGGVALLNSRGSTLMVAGGAKEPTAAPTSIANSSPMPSAIPYAFPVDNTLIVSKYDEARSRIPEAGRADAKLHAFSVECFDPRANADCTMEYKLYSRQTDMLYGLTFSVFDTRPVEEFFEPAVDNAHRITFVTLPWEQNPAWPKLLAESFAQIPAGYGQDGFEVEMFSDALPLNEGDYEWAVQYTDKATSEYVTFYLRGTRVSKSS